MSELFKPILLRYQGYDARRNEIDLLSLGESLKGASRMLLISSNFVLTQRYVSRTPAMSVKVLAGTSRRGSWELPLIIAPIVPILPDIYKAVSSHFVEHVLNWALAKFGGKPNEAEMYKEVCMKSIEEQSRVSIEAIKAMQSVAEKVVDAQRASAKRLVDPVGESCEELTIGDPKKAISVDKPMKDAINEDGDMEILDEKDYVVFFSEIDIRNRTGKLSIHGDGRRSRRYPAVILDAAIRNVRNVYSQALAGGTWIKVRGQMQIKNTEPYRLYVLRALD